MISNIGQYKIIEELGHGSYSTVYHASHSALGNQVTIKVLLPSLSANENARKRFTEEAQLAASLTHPNILPILDLDDDKGQFFIIMEFIPGNDLSKELLNNKNKFTNKQIIHILQQAASALDYAHSNNIFHKDIKPSNILIDQNGNVHLCDFGLVGVAAAAKLNTVGNAAYISPEQAEGKLIDGHSDQYSLGIIAFELLTGELPFKGDSSTALALMHLTKQPPIPSSINPQLSSTVSDVILKALDKEPKNRFDNCTLFINSLSAALEDSQISTFKSLLVEARSLLSNGDIENSRKKIDAAKNIQLDRPDLIDDLSELDNTNKAANQYNEIVINWKKANDDAKSVLEMFPDYPDREGVFEFLGLRKIEWTKPSNKEIILQILAGMFFGLPIFAFILYETFRWITR